MKSEMMTNLRVSVALGVLCFSMVGCSKEDTPQRPSASATTSAAASARDEVAKIESMIRELLSTAKHTRDAATFRRLIDDYPDTTEAKVAQLWLTAFSASQERRMKEVGETIGMITAVDGTKRSVTLEMTEPRTFGGLSMPPGGRLQLVLELNEAVKFDSSLLAGDEALVLYGIGYPKGNFKYKVLGGFLHDPDGNGGTGFPIPLVIVKKPGGSAVR